MRKVRGGGQQGDEEPREPGGAATHSTAGGPAAQRAGSAAVSRLAWGRSGRPLAGEVSEGEGGPQIRADYSADRIQTMRYGLLDYLQTSERAIRDGLALFLKAELAGRLRAQPPSVQEAVVERIGEESGRFLEDKVKSKARKLLLREARPHARVEASGTSFAAAVTGAATSELGELAGTASAALVVTRAAKAVTDEVHEGEVDATLYRTIDELCRGLTLHTLLYFGALRSRVRELEQHRVVEAWQDVASAAVLITAEAMAFWLSAFAREAMRDSGVLSVAEQVDDVQALIHPRPKGAVK